MHGNSAQNLMVFEVFLRGESIVRVPNGLCWVWVCFSLVALSGCAFKKDAAPAAGARNTVEDGLPRIEEWDWEVSSSQVRPGVLLTKRSLKAEKLSQIQRFFRVTEGSPFVVPESSGFQLIEIHRMKELEDKAFIVPRLYIAPTAAQGKIFVSETSVTDPSGERLYDLSVPVALIDGRSKYLPILGSGAAKPEVAQLSDSELIKDVAALERAVAPRLLTTLTACPETITLQFGDMVLAGETMAIHGGLCPINQFFRVNFRGVRSVVSGILERSAKSPDVGSISISLKYELSLPKEIQELTIQPEIWSREFVAALRKRNSQVREVALHEVEEAQDALALNLMREIDPSPSFPQNYEEFARRISDSVLSPPKTCDKGICRTVHSDILGGAKDIRTLRWVHQERLTLPIQVHANAGFGPQVAAVEFVSNPSLEDFLRGSRPSAWTKLSATELVNVCEIGRAHV